MDITTIKWINNPLYKIPRCSIYLGQPQYNLFNILLLSRDLAIIICFCKNKKVPILFRYYKVTHYPLSSHHHLPHVFFPIILASKPVKTHKIPRIPMKGFPKPGATLVNIIHLRLKNFARNKPSSVFGPWLLAVDLQIPPSPSAERTDHGHQLVTVA